MQLDQFLNQLNAIVWGKKLPGLANLGLAVDLVCLKKSLPFGKLNSYRKSQFLMGISTIHGIEHNRFIDISYPNVYFEHL